LLRQIGNGEFHRATDRDLNNAFVLVDPSVGVQRLLRVFTHCFQLFHALLRAPLFVITSTRHGPNDREHDHAKQREEKDNPEPCGQRRA
jgi:hypothetical protein